MSRRRSGAVVGGVVACLVALGLTATLRGYPAEFHADLTRREATTPADRARFDALWRAHLQAADRALAEHDVSAAVRAWHDAYGAALASRGWEGMLAAGDAFLRIGAASGTPSASRPKARQAYLTALVRARHDASAEGVRQTAGAFAALGDRAVAAQCLRVADELGRTGRSAR
jgi:hypothetical protein